MYSRVPQTSVCRMGKVYNLDIDQWTPLRRGGCNREALKLRRTTKATNIVKGDGFFFWSSFLLPYRAV